MLKLYKLLLIYDVYCLYCITQILWVMNIMLIDSTSICKFLCLYLNWQHNLCGKV